MTGSLSDFSTLSLQHTTEFSICFTLPSVYTDIDFLRHSLSHTLPHKRFIQIHNSTDLHFIEVTCSCSTASICQHSNRKDG